jgi:hypothetical protein
MSRPHHACRLLASVLCAAAALPAVAQEFAAVVSPPRFEDRVKPGTTYRNVIEIANVSPRPGRYTVETADWTLDAQGAPVFTKTLVPNSCRPWVGIEAAEIRLDGNGKRRFRFEAKVPADAPRGECRFAIMIESEPQIARGNVPLPVSGRIGVIVYLAIGDAAPALQVLEIAAVDVQGKRLPALRVRNDGDMHARLDGFLAGLDANGKRIVLVPDNSPILPGATRQLALYPQTDDGAAAPEIAWPLRLRGRLDADRQRLDIETTVTR